LRAGERRAGDVERSVLDPTRFVSILGSLTNLTDGLKKTGDWFARR